ncbi:hypothetical protein FOA52_008773 [Chlamydomonas sp. UWO 241]|nr:hypothetical protein FOA52_008773 [Chlamydomonas sp. UWO 241]
MPDDGPFPPEDCSAQCVSGNVSAIIKSDSDPLRGFFSPATDPGTDYALQRCSIAAFGLAQKCGECVATAFEAWDCYTCPGASADSIVASSCLDCAVAGYGSDCRQCAALGGDDASKAIACLACLTSDDIGSDCR